MDHAFLVYVIECFTNMAGNPDRASWDFGRLLGVYVVFFFVVAQLISWLVFHQPPSTAVLVGGAFIVVGGAVMTV